MRVASFIIRTSRGLADTTCPPSRPGQDMTAWMMSTLPAPPIPSECCFKFLFQNSNLPWFLVRGSHISLTQKWPLSGCVPKRHTVSCTTEYGPHSHFGCSPPLPKAWLILDLNCRRDSLNDWGGWSCHSLNNIFFGGFLFCLLHPKVRCGGMVQIFGMWVAQQNFVFNP